MKHKCAGLIMRSAIVLAIVSMTVGLAYPAEGAGKEIVAGGGKVGASG